MKVVVGRDSKLHNTVQKKILTSLKTTISNSVDVLAVLLFV